MPININFGLSHLLIDCHYFLSFPWPTAILISICRILIRVNPSVVKFLINFFMKLSDYIKFRSQELKNQNTILSFTLPKSFIFHWNLNQFRHPAAFSINKFGQSLCILRQRFRIVFSFLGLYKKGKLIFKCCSKLEIIDNDFLFNELHYWFHYIDCRVIN